MDDERPWKRRRLDHTEIATIFLDIPSPLSHFKNITGECIVSDLRANAAASRAIDTTVTESDDSVNSDLVCYGMLENLPIISNPTTTIIDNPMLVPAYLNENGIVQRSSDGACVGKLEDRAMKCLFKIHFEDHVEIQFMLKTVTSKSYRKGAARPVGLASAIIYGPEDLSDDVGDFLDRSDYVLQDPFSCERNVPYKNPHCLSTLFEMPRMTFELRSPDLGYHEFTLSNSLQALETTGDLPEWRQPVALKTELHRHQKQALRFFIDREGPKRTNHIWQNEMLINESSTYFNVVTGSSQQVSPPQWNGGILADEMGLGKTLEMISLIAADRELQRHPLADQLPSTTAPLMSTLVVLPLSLISVWEYQLKYHLHPSTLSCGRHHRNCRLACNSDLTFPDVVLTTYQTV
ncbi:SNF2 family N-terminal domain-containing protein [Nemania sp. NC0429]|nr:SNF2 family N-terminal domain-containing protein [Nemania sp. NC0429]